MKAINQYSILFYTRHQYVVRPAKDIIQRRAMQHCDKRAYMCSCLMCPYAPLYLYSTLDDACHMR